MEPKQNSEPQPNNDQQPSPGLPPSPEGSAAPAAPEPSNTLFQPDSFTPAANAAAVPPPKKSKRKLIIAAVIALAVTGLAAGVVFGYYLPNRPENVYRTGLERSGQAMDKLVDQATEKEKLEQIKKSEINGNFDISSDAESFTGDLNVKLNPTQSDGQLNVKFKESGPEHTIGLKFLTDLQKDKRFPDLYFQITGLKTLGLDQSAPGITDYEGKWIAVEAAYVESLGGGFLPPGEQKNKENVSAEEISQLIRAISDVNNEYVFTTNADKAILENREYLGKEKTAEGIDAFHYKIGLHKEHSLAYCKALVDRVLAQPAARKIANMDDNDVENAKKSAHGDCDDAVKDLKADDIYEMWVDTKYKLIHKFRVYSEKDKKDKYTDFGQIYSGGDKLALFCTYHEDQDNLNMKFTLDVDIEANNSKAEFTSSQEGSNKNNAKATLNAKPYAGELKVDKPAGAIPIKDVLTRYGYDPAL